MSNIAIQGAATGTGVFTLASPATNTDRVITLPDEAGTVLTSAGVPASAMPAGSVIQFVETNTDANINTSANDTLTDSGMVVTINPTSASNKLIVEVLGGSITYGSTFAQFNIYLYRSINGGSYTNLKKLSQIRQQSTWNTPHAYSYVDTPNTIQSVSYRLYYAGSGSSIYMFNANATPITFSIKEVQA